MSDEQTRTKEINENAAAVQEDILLQLETGDMAEDDLLAMAYASLIAYSLLGYSTEHLASDAAKAADKIATMADAGQDEQTE